MCGCSGTIKTKLNSKSGDFVRSSLVLDNEPTVTIYTTTSRTLSSVVLNTQVKLIVGSPNRVFETDLREWLLTQNLVGIVFAFDEENIRFFTRFPELRGVAYA